MNDKNEFNILIVDDARSNLEVLCHILKPGYAHSTSKSGALNYSLSVAKSGQAALKKVREDKPDLILLDIVMPDMSGFEVLSQLKADDATSSIPVIFITGLDSVEDEERGFFLGAVDYITKPFHSSIVKARIRTHLQIIEQMRMIERLGLIDSLTNIPNRRSFDNQLMVEFGRAMRSKEPLSLLMIDIDNFKNYNDTYGHQQGDVVLRTVAKVISATLRRSSDLAARWGGEEFASLLPNTGADGAIEVGEKIRANMELTMVPGSSIETPIYVTVSVGAVSRIPINNDTPEDFVADADKALYAAKQAGKNRVCLL